MLQLCDGARLARRRGVAALRGRGFAAARSAYDGDASKLGSSRRVRTDAPAAVFADVLERVVRPAKA